jgi:hypothetical protein
MSKQFDAFAFAAFVQLVQSKVSDMADARAICDAAVAFASGKPIGSAAKKPMELTELTAKDSDLAIAYVEKQAPRTKNNNPDIMAISTTLGVSYMAASALCTGVSKRSGSIVKLTKGGLEAFANVAKQTLAAKPILLNADGTPKLKAAI